MANGKRPGDEVVRKNIIEWNIPQPDRDYTVVIHCSTYNHGKYIKDALEGFVNQKCSYSFCAIVIDDGSSDNAPAIIREYTEKYPEIIKPILLGVNHMQHGVLREPYFEKWHQCAKYIAFCEGDDYWTDPLKLQKQVDFMEANEEYSMCFHKASIIKEVDRTVWLCCDDIEERDYSATELFERWIVPTNSIVYRKKEVNKYRIRNQNNVLNGDIFLVEKCAHCGRVRGMSEIMSIYRVQSNGMTYDQSRQKERIIHYPKHYKELKSDFPQIDKKVINSFIGKAYFNKAGIMKSLLARRWYITIGSLYCPSLLFKKISRMWKKSNE